MHRCTHCCNVFGSPTDNCSPTTCRSQSSRSRRSSKPYFRDTEANMRKNFHSFTFFITIPSENLKIIYIYFALFFVTPATCKIFLLPPLHWPIFFPRCKYPPSLREVARRRRDERRPPQADAAHNTTRLHDCPNYSERI